MPGMKQIKAAIGCYKALAGHAQLLTPRSRGLGTKDFGGTIHRLILPMDCSFAMMFAATPKCPKFILFFEKMDRRKGPVRENVS